MIVLGAQARGACLLARKNTSTIAMLRIVQKMLKEDGARLGPSVSVMLQNQQLTNVLVC